jgi:hypothetical protein
MYSPLRRSAERSRRSPVGMGSIRAQYGYLHGVDGPDWGGVVAAQDVGQALAFGGSSTIGLMVGGLKLLGRWGSPNELK